jgi:hypothetical protein
MKTNLGISTVICLSTLTLYALSPPAAAQDLDPVAQWNLVALEAARGQSPLAQTRTLAIVHAAMFDAANGVDRRFGPFLVDQRTPELASGSAALAAAAHTVLATLFPDRRPTLDAALVASLSAPTAAAEREQGLAFGRRIGEAVLAQRKHDGSADARPYQRPPAAGVWRPTPPAHLPALAPHWGAVRPFLVAELTRFAPPPPPAITSARYARDFAEVKLVGARQSQRRSPDQTAAAVFWTASASAIWSSAARQAVARRPNLSLVERARVFALFTGAMADAAMVGWGAKFEHVTWRPITAIRLADTDGNGATQADATWEPVIVTPPFPCYISGHAVTAGAAQRTLTLALGEDRIDLEIANPDLGLSRRYESFSQLAREALEVRIWSGVHFRASQEEGLRAGHRVGEASATTRLQPVRLSRGTPP